jgi:pilus assembly protein CpaF
MVLMGEVQLPLSAVRSQLESALDLVVQVARFPEGRRRIVAVAEVLEAAGEGEAGGRTRLIADADGLVRR